MDNLWILIPLAPFLLGGFFIWTRHQTHLAELHIQSAADLAADKAARHATTVAELEERMRVLERIITDGSYDTALQIEALRDRREVEAERIPGPPPMPAPEETRQ
ncbi:hypothetical protein [Novosphingobium sp. 9]|uniref:hypothetical protein n=1 Tax=Novosphingobium sp. 9 TaxID=2025349 RepID=UPI0021B61EBF|nr:hypothetical protein [Novosphingobium sp. 9]